MIAAEQYVVATVRDEPGNLRALEIFARVLAAEKHYDSAALIARRAAAIDKRAAEPRVILGEIALAQGHLAEALIHFEEGISSDTYSQGALDGLTRLFRRGPIDKVALRKMESIAETVSPSPTLMEITGRLYSAQNMLEDARRCFARALQMDPLRRSAALSLARVFAGKDQTEPATKYAKKAGGKSAFLLSAFQAERNNDVVSATADYETAVRQGEDSGVAANNLAWIYTQQNTNLDRALFLAQSARAKAPSNPAILDTLGVVYLRRRQYSEAISVLKMAHEFALLDTGVEAHHLITEVRRHLSEAYTRAGQPEAAVQVQGASARRGASPPVREFVAQRKAGNGKYSPRMTFVSPRLPSN